jgi:putative hydrolase of HD superfamily
MSSDGSNETIGGILAFLREAELLKRQTRTAWTADGAEESVAEHTWRVALLVLAMEDQLDKLDLAQMLRMALVHDLGEAYEGDISAALQSTEDGKEETERAGVYRLTEGLPLPTRDRLIAAWEEYSAGTSAEAHAVKALDKIETIVQHNQGVNPQSFDYRFNLEYGRKSATAHAAIEQLRAAVDRETQARADEAEDRFR